MESKNYQTAEAFRAALEARLAQQSGTAMSIERLRQQAAFDRFLARIIETADPDYLLKGGYAMELRLRHRARFSRDLDLAAKHELGKTDPETVRTKLQRLAAKDLGDWFSYRISESTMDLEGAPYAGYRFPVEARLAGRTFARFHVDIAIGDPVQDDPVWMKASALFEFAGIQTPNIPLLPAETHFAEKIHTYTRPREGVNSRVRDLVDLILLLDEGFHDLDRLRGAIRSTFTRRDTHPIPNDLIAPHPSWAKTYAAIASEIQLTTASTADEAYQRISDYWKRLFTFPDRK